MFRSIAPLASCLLVSLTILVPAQQPVPLADDQDFQNGLAALGDELPELAVTRLKKALEARNEDDPARASIQLHLVEAYVRAERIEAALSLLDLPALVEHPVAIFWKAGAQVTLGHYFEATETLGELAGTPDAALRNTAALNRARLLAGLGERKEALLLLQSMTETDDLATRHEAALLRGSILLDAGALEEASTLLVPLEPESRRLAKQQSYLLARLALARGSHEEAAQRFLALVDDPQHLPQTLFFGAILGHADALAALGSKDKAVEFLLDPVQKKEEAKEAEQSALRLEDVCTAPRQLEQLFARLVPWSSENEALSSLLQSRFVAWAKSNDHQGDTTLRSLDEPIATALAWKGNAGTTMSEIGIYALFHHAMMLTQKNDPESAAKAKRLLNRLRLEDPVHPLALASLLETALLHLGDQRWEVAKRRNNALGCLESLEALADPGNLKAEAAELAARIRFADGDYPEAADAFSRARANLASDANRFTAINQGLAQLMSGNDGDFNQLLATLDDDEAAKVLELERAVLLAGKRDASAKPLLDEFLRTHPGHIRSAEARLALAELSMLTDPRDLAMALAQLDSIDPAAFSNRTALRYLLARLKLGELTGEWDVAIANATNYLRTRDTPEQPAVLLKLGEAFFLNGNYNEARIQFSHVLKLEEAARHHEVARFYAAKAGLRVGTQEANQSALALLGQVAAENGPLAVEARLQLARAYIDNAQPDPALRELAPILGEDADHASRVDALLLAAEAHLAMGDDSHNAECLVIYDELLARKDLPYALNNRVHLLQGRALETLGKAGGALESYYRVINGENRPKNTPVTEWQWFYDCGFRALTLLEEDKSWRAALAVARILADTDGYRADDARLRAENIQLEHMIWEDE